MRRRYRLAVPCRSQDEEAAWLPGTYALLGAAAVLSGVTHMTLTLAAILTELAADVELLLAIMLVLMIAKAVRLHAHVQDVAHL